MKRIIVLCVLGPVIALLLGCSEESRKAWVSILPEKSVEEASAEEGTADTVTGDTVPMTSRSDAEVSSAILSDTLTVDQMPRVLVSEPISDAWIQWIETQ